MCTALLGPRYDADDIARLLATSGEQFLDFRGRCDELLAAVVDRLAEGLVVGWFHGRMEFGPRALGARSIIADPRDPQMRNRINVLVKKREAFRPFAPVVLVERAMEHFKINHESPFMSETCQVISSLDLPAITHVDGTARVQTVTAEQNPRLHRLIEAFATRTGCPILLNTSFNLRGEPIVCTPVDALLCFLRSAIDCLVLEDIIVDRDNVPQQWRAWFEDTDHPTCSTVSNTVYTLL
jgi:carbamoyltransferase